MTFLNSESYKQAILSEHDVDTRYPEKSKKMHREMVGYVGIKHQDKEKIHEQIAIHSLSDLDCHEDEVMTEVNPKMIKELTGSVITEEDAKELIEHCDIVKFYT